jgi:hypothetical protein
MSSDTSTPRLSSSSFTTENIQTISEMVAQAISNSTTIRNPSNSTEEMTDQEWIKVLITVFSAFIMIFIIIAAIFGNLLVIISVMRVRKLR